MVEAVETSFCYIPPPHILKWTSQATLMVKNTPAMQEPQETQVWSLGQEDALEEGTATCSSILAWKTPWTEEPGGLQFMGLQLSDWACVHTHTHTFEIQSAKPGPSLKDQRHRNKGTGVLKVSCFRLYIVAHMMEASRNFQLLQLLPTEAIT